MSDGLNRVYLLGRVGQRPELDEHGRRPRLRLRVCTVRTRRIDGQKFERSEWHTVVAYGPLADYLATLLCTDSRVLVEGYLQSRHYEHGGRGHEMTVVVAERVQLTGGRRRAKRRKE